MKTISYLPYDKHDCICQEMVKRLSTLPIKPGEIFKCPRHQDILMNQYEVLCKKCKERVAYLYATDKKLTDWCDVHYTCEKEDGEWKGAMTVNNSPIDMKLGFECACGNDTRDFRGNLKYPKKAKNNLKGRDFGKPNSKFKLKEV